LVGALVAIHRPLLEGFFQILQNLSLGGEPPRLELAIQGLAVDADLKGAARRGNQRDLGQAIAKLGQDLFRQTGGSW
jgi:hypothetical protein